MSTIIPYLYLIIGGLFFLYFILLWMHCRRIPAFGWCWPLSGLCMTILGMFTKDYTVMGPDGISTVFYDENITILRSFCIEILPFIFMIMAAVFLAGIYVIYFYGKRSPFVNADYVIVLGAHVNKMIPSRALMSRIMAACHYLKDNPSAKAVLTGGQGSGEDMTEALCMKRELLKHGIEQSRLLIEDKSTTTEENITFAKKIIIDDICAQTGQDHVSIDNPGDNISLENTSIIVVTNDFHALRGKYLAKAAGFKKVEPLCTVSSPIMKPHYYTREVLSWIKLGFRSICK